MSLDGAKVALVGGGVIGGGWAGRLVEHGFDVAIYDPHPDSERRVREMLDNAERAWSRLTMAPRRRGKARFCASLAEAVADAGFIQESAPEREDLKRKILAEIDAHARPDALIGSSTSGLLPSKLQAGMRRPERFFVGHPFNPVYLLPLVEVCGGEKTSETVLDRALAFYAGIGMKPLRIRKEIDGFVADRLLEALWREALWLVHDDVATTEEVDDAIRYGAGLRWAMMGTFLVYRIAGGEDGMRHFMAQFGPALKWPWTKLMDVPELTASFIDKIAEQSDAQAGGLSIRDLERKRDDGLIAIMQGLKIEDFAAGRLLAGHEARLYEASGHNAPTTQDPAKPLALHGATARPDWVDYNNHMTEARYCQVFSDTTDAFLIHVGMSEDYRREAGTFFTVETHTRLLGEVRGLEPVSVTTQVLKADEKRLHLFHEMRHRRTGELVATSEHMLLHVDAQSRRSAPMREPVAGTVADIALAQANLPQPEGAGRRVGDRP
ncbi:carnitine 3-dehydrogenase [Rhizobiales bacterium GAS191]|nr:carnitine 3-dehydrogenase [Rhizobiales bacterium GAS191]